MTTRRNFLLGSSVLAATPFLATSAAANEVTNTIVEFAIDQNSGRLRPTGEVVGTGSPVCVVFRHA